MTIEQRGKSYRIKQMVKGKMYSVTLDHKPSKKEATILMAELLNGDEKRSNSSFLSAIKGYLEKKSNVLSPSTLRGYDKLYTKFPEWLLDMNIYEINKEVLQTAVNEYAEGRSPKTVSNMASFCKSVISFYRESFNPKIKLPQQEAEKDIYVPSSEEVKKILEVFQDTDFEVAMRLATYGLRRSEILAVDSSCLDGNILHICKTKVEGRDGAYIEKVGGKTKKSTRDIYIDDELADLIRKYGKAYDGYINEILRELHRVQDKLGIPRFRLHDMRHYFCTELSEEGFSQQAILDLGGWSSPRVMEKVYRHSRIKQDEEQKKQAMEVLQKKIRAGN